MAGVQDLLPEVCLEVPKCHAAHVRKALQHTVRRFCQMTHYWQIDMAPITLLSFNEQAPGTYLYEIPIPDGARLTAIRYLIYQQKVLPMKSVDWLDSNLGQWRERIGEPWYYLMFSDRRVRFVPASDEVRPQAISGRLVLEPDRGSQSFGDDLLEYDEGLIHGALARLLMMGNKPWSDPRRAQACLVSYQDAESRAKLQVMKDFSDGAETREQRSWL